MRQFIPQALPFSVQATFADTAGLRHFWAARPAFAISFNPPRSKVELRLSKMYMNAANHNRSCPGRVEPAWISRVFPENEGLA
jgi:hypothetical protein